MRERERERGFWHSKQFAIRKQGSNQHVIRNPKPSQTRYIPSKFPKYSDWNFVAKIWTESSG